MLCCPGPCAGLSCSFPAAPAGLWLCCHAGRAAHTWARDLPGPLVLLLTTNCLTELLLNPATARGTRTRFQGALLASSVCDLCCLQPARAQSLFPACCAAALPQHAAAEGSVLPSIPLQSGFNIKARLGDREGKPRSLMHETLSAGIARAKLIQIREENPKIL